MTKLQTKITTAIATGAVLLNALAPISFAATELTITDNGAGSTNAVSVSDTNTQTTTQTNQANVTNNVTNNINTGKNAANFNTGDGAITVKSGDAKATTAVTNALNTNVAEQACCQAGGETKVTLDGNGAFSKNSAALSQSNTTVAAQANVANVTNAVANNVDTGNNQAGYNTGDNTTVVISGNVDLTTVLSTTGNTNVMKQHPSSAVAAAGGTELLITDNGAGSTNAISAYMPNVTVLTQTNQAAVANSVANNANTGKNAANFNTGDGLIVIDGGNITATTIVGNDLNFNGADLDCGCLLDGGVTAKIHGNGASVLPGYNSLTTNAISAVLGNTETLAQVNAAGLSNSYGGNYDTGYNEAMFSTMGSDDADPAILGGNVVANTSVSNEGNTNISGNFTLPWTLPQVQTSFDFGGLVNFWSMWL